MTNRTELTKTIELGDSFGFHGNLFYYSIAFSIKGI